MGQEVTLSGTGGDTEGSRAQKAEEKGNSGLFRGLQRAKGFGAVRIGEDSRESVRKEPALINDFDKLGKARKSFPI